MNSCLLSPSRTVVRHLICQHGIEHGHVLARNCRKFCISAAALRKRTEKIKSKILGLTSLVMQDGNDFKDMQFLINISTGINNPSLHNYSYSGSNRSLNDFDLQLQLQLQNANSLEDIYTRLQIPTGKISAESAAYALQKICILKKDDFKGNYTNSFISAAVINELYSTVTRDKDKISCSTLFMLLDTFHSSEILQETFGIEIKEEIEKRIGSQAFSLEELCTLSDILCHYVEVPDCKDLLNTVWIHIQNRWKEINADSVARIYAAVPKKYFNNIQVLLCKQLLAVWWKLNSLDVKSILSALLNKKIKSRNELIILGEWIAVTFSQISEEDMTLIIKSFMELEYVDDNLLEILGKYIPVKLTADSLSLDFVLLSLSYCKFARYIDDKLLRATSEHFIRHYREYSHKQLQTLLSVFSFLVYTPASYLEFFINLEVYLLEEVDNIDCMVLMDMVTSLLILGRPPFNIKRHIFSHRFFGKVKALRGQEYDRVVAQINHFENIGYGLTIKPTLTFKKEPTNELIYEMKHQEHSAEYESQVALMHRKLVNMFGKGKVLCNRVVEYGIIDFQFTFQTFYRPEQKEKYAVLLLNQNCFCYNQPERLLGKQVAYAQVLRNQGYKVIQLRTCDVTTTRWNVPDDVLYQNFKRLSITYF